MNSCITAPDGMSYVNVWYALYTAASKEDPSAPIDAKDLVSTSDKVARLFINYPKKTYPMYYMNREGGKIIGVDFSEYPRLDVEEYDRLYGLNAAKKILEDYQTVSPKNRFDSNDSYQFSDLQG